MFGWGEGGYLNVEGREQLTSTCRVTGVCSYIRLRWPQAIVTRFAAQTDRFKFRKTLMDGSAHARSDREGAGSRSRFWPPSQAELHSRH